MMLDIGHFPSSPWAPFYALPQRWASDRWVDCVSSEVRQLALAGKLHATPMATVDWLDLQDRFERIGAFGLAYRDVARSVLLFSNDPIDELDGAAIAVSTETATSVRVLRALLGGRYGLSLGPLLPMSADVPASTPRLLIQDEAIEEAARKRFAHVYDMGEEWWAWQHTPIVSAVWVRRVDLAQEDVQRCAATLSESLDWSEAHPREMAHAFLANSRSASLDEQGLLALSSNFRFRLGPEEEQGIEVMRRLLEPRSSIAAAYERGSVNSKARQLRGA